MALKREYATQDEIPEALRSAYVERDGKFILDLETGGDDSKLKGALEKERKDRANLERMLADIKSKLGDADPAKAREALTALADLEEKALLGELPPGLQTKVDGLVAKRTERMAADHKKREEELLGENKTFKTKLEELLIDNAIRAAATKSGVRATAVEDAVLLGKTVFRLKDGNPVPMKGEEILYGKEPNKPMTMEEWLAERATDRAHWFEPSTGGGATPPGGGTRQGGAGTLILTKDKAKDPAAYRAAKEQAAKAGQELVIQ
jgi:hypothetical protein